MAKKVNIKELARRYTTAVFDLAKAENKLPQIGKDLKSLQNMLKSDELLQRALGIKIAQGEQIELVKELAKGFDSLTLNFLLLIAQNGRLAHLAEISQSFQDKIAEANGELKVQITSAQKLNEDQLKSIAADLGAKTGKAVKLQENINPEIIGGLIVKIGARMFDYSIKSRLSKLKNNLKAAS